MIERRSQAGVGVALGFALCAVVVSADRGKAATIPATPYIPTAQQVPLDLPAGASQEIRASSAALYDYVRSELIASGIDHETAIIILSSITLHGHRDFDSYTRNRPGLLRRPRPSLLSQLCWRKELGKIADGAEHKFLPPSAWLPQPPEPAEEDIVVDMPSPDNRVLSRITSAARNALAGLEELETPCPDRLVASSLPPSRWKRPVRIASTGLRNVDERIAAAVAEIRSRVPGAPLDTRSFPAPPGTANIYFSRPGALSSSFWLVGSEALFGCVRTTSCLSIGRMVGDHPGKTRTPHYATTMQFLAHAYLSRPYRVSLSLPIALVQLGAGGEIAGAACSSEDRGRGDRDEQIRTTSCLAQALGAYPADAEYDTGYDAKEEAKLIDTEMSQLAKIY